MRIVVRQDEAGQWWWAAVRESGETAAVSILYASRTDCMRGVAELKVEGPAAPIVYEEPAAAGPGTWTISRLIPSGSSRSEESSSAPTGDLVRATVPDGAPNSARVESALEQFLP